MDADTQDREYWYRRRVKALESLLAFYRVGRHPTEKLHRELDVTRTYVGHEGEWLGGPDTNPEVVGDGR